MKKFNLIHLILITLAVFFFSLIISSIKALESLELKTIDWRFSYRGPLPIEDSPIVIVTIDDQSFDVLPERWPWPRSYYARVIENLHQAGAKVVGLDVILDKPDEDNPASDSMLAAAIANTGNVVLTGKIEQSSQQRTYFFTVEPIPLFLETSDSSWGLGSIQIDEDGFYRRYIIAREHRDEYLPSFALAVLKKYEDYGPDVSLRNTDAGIQYGEFNIAAYDESSMLINFAGPEGTFPTYSFDSVIDDSTFFVGEDYDLDYFEELLADGVFQDKIILIGSTVAELHDNFPTPFLGYKDQPKEMPGVEIHANAINTILNGNYLQQPNYFLYLLIVLLLVILVQFLSLRFSTAMSTILTVVVALIYIAAQFYLFSKFSLVMGMVFPAMAIFLSYVANNIYQYVQTQKEKQMIMGAFARYVPEKVVKELLAHPEKLKLGGEERFMSVLFSDIAGFTSISETMSSPSELVQLINEYLTAMTDVIQDHDGIIDKYEGDAIMAEFGAPVYYEDHALKACHAALHMQDRLKELSQKLEKENRPVLKSRIGINTGNMIVGNMGSNKVFDYTVLGDEVNLASRLEGANKIFGTYIMISESTNQIIKDHLVTRTLDMIRVKGKQKPVKVYELIGRKEDGYYGDILSTYENGVRYYRDRNWDQAMECFKFCLKRHPDDGPTRLYLRRIYEYMKTPPPPDWDGVFTMKTK